MSVLSAFGKNIRNLFRDQQPEADGYRAPGPSYSGGVRPDRTYLRGSNERSIIASVLMRISIDVADLAFRHVMLDKKGRYTDDIDSALNRCLTFEPNLDQGPRAFRQDIALTMMDTNEACIVPVDIIRRNGEVVDIVTMRVGRVIEWQPQHVKVSVFNPESMRREDVWMPKTRVAIPDNPLYTVMNGPNSTLNRLIRKLNLLDVVDEQSSSGKLDLIIQLPYTVRGDVKREQVNNRRDELEAQLQGSKYGVAWADASEKITQLNRPVENNLLSQIEFLTDLLYSQMGLTKGVMDGSADEKEMLNYFNRTVKPFAESIVEAMVRTFVGLDAWQRGERIRYYRDPFTLVPIGQMADIADKFTRNEILTANEMRGFMGIEPHDDPKADELLNSNINPTGMELAGDGSVVPKPASPASPVSSPEADRAAASAGFDEIDKAITEVFDSLEVSK